MEEALNIDYNSVAGVKSRATRGHRSHYLNGFVGVLTMTVVPYLAFAVALLSLANRPDDFIVWVVCIASCATLFIFSTTRVVLGHPDHRNQGYLFGLMAVALTFAMALGIPASRIAFRIAHPIVIYRNVPTLDPAGMYIDAGGLIFTESAKVATAKYGSVDHFSTKYCVAPIVSIDDINVADFWAAGTDCCNDDGGFFCGPVGDSSVHAGQRIASSMFSDANDPYRSAVTQASHRYGISASKEAILVEWMSAADLDADKPESVQVFGASIYMLCLYYLPVAFLFALIAQHKLNSASAV